MELLPQLRQSYLDNLSWLWVFPAIMAVAAIGVFGVTYAETGDVIYRDLSLQGGVSLTALNGTADSETVESALLESFPSKDISVRTLTELGTPIGVVVEADIDPQQGGELDEFTTAVSQETGVSEEDISVDTVGASLGSQFFRQTMQALWIAFLFMGACVFYYFDDNTTRRLTTAAVSLVTGGIILGTSSILGYLVSAALTAGLLVTYTKYSIPSIAIIAAALSDIVVTVAVLTFFEVKLGTASIAGLLMLIGYSVDTDILLSTRVLKETEDEYGDRVIDAFTTGITMTLTTLSAVTVTYLLAQSQTLAQIMLVLVTGLSIDIINTWLQNASLLDIHRTWTA